LQPAHIRQRRQKGWGEKKTTTTTTTNERISTRKTRAGKKRENKNTYETAVRIFVCANMAEKVKQHWAAEEEEEEGRRKKKNSPPLHKSIEWGQKPLGTKNDAEK
jgi:hypothetical protein